MSQSPLEPDWTDVPTDDDAEPSDAGGDHDGIDPDDEVG